MHALNRRDHHMPIITENYLRGAMMPCLLLLALPDPAVPFMAGASDPGKLTGDRPRSSASGRDHSAIWLRNAAAGLCLLAAAAAAAAVSFTAQYRLIQATRRLAVVAGLEAAIPDAAALVFACLGIALALHGRRAIRARALNLAAVGTSVFMNAIAAAPGWRNLAIWVMPPIAYALASDTLIAVVRTSALARHQHLGTVLAADQATPLALLGGLILWLLRLALAPKSTLAGFRAWVLAECPVAPGRCTPSAALPQMVPSPRLAKVRRETKTARFLFFGDRTPRPSRLDPPRSHRPDQRPPGTPGRPEPRRRPHRAPQSRSRRPQRRPLMMLKYAIALAILIVLAAVFTWAFLPAR
jgi:hypothetical protein